MGFLEVDFGLGFGYFLVFWWVFGFALFVFVFRDDLRPLCHHTFTQKLKRELCPISNCKIWKYQCIDTAQHENPTSTQTATEVNSFKSRPCVYKNK